MKKIGILTFHFADNYGAVLQCFALNKLLNSYTNISAEVINYVPANFQYQKCWHTSYQRKLWVEKREKFKRFLEKNCNLGNTQVTKVVDGEYDYYCVGSDQIWNTDPMLQEYFLPNVKCHQKKVSYAASVGLGTNDFRLRKDIFKKYVSKFQRISVRENEHVEMMKLLTGKECISVLDPTLLLTESDYIQLLPDKKLHEKEYVFFFWLQSNSSPLPGIELANRLARKYEIPIVHSLYDVPYKAFYIDGGSMAYKGIEEFLWYVKNAKYIVTNSYHGAIFSILFKKNFWVFPVESMRSRLDTLKEKLDIGVRIVEEYKTDTEVIRPVDYGVINRNLEEERKHSFAYIQETFDISE